MSNHKFQRPLSPHLTIYRPQITSVLSITHRITGIGLTIGILPLTLWLYAIAYDASLFESLQHFFTGFIGRLLLIGWTLAFYYHLGNGLRHLNWDIGRGFALPDVTASGQLVLVFTVAMTVFTWAIIFSRLGA